jgi:hypothetical protein
MHRFGPEMQSKRLSTRHVILNPIGPNAPLQTRVPTSPNPFIELNHFEEELLKENGLPEDMLKDMTKTKVLPNGGGRLARMSTIDRLFFQKLKKKCNSQEKTLDMLSKSLHLAIHKSKVIPKCVDWNYVKVFNFSIFNLKS